MNYKELIEKKNFTYTDIAHELGCCEQTARNKISGKTKITKAEQELLNRILNNEEGESSCNTISRHNR